ncbi:DNA polymerase III subunit delta' [Paenibacillus montaniterrae]|uniref:DNA polymerase III subunit delta' n=1 Tax=Paenibacillus montaniterrae TaxID=429341 RepID=A0A920D1H1_9BACL|nr:DNA polymerase III subunit delta' [Paenibacillus montaniterrae]GIP19583.1 DNA polymerase III subunit delta' [Paenibacillus montaniterrae]
MKTEETLTPQWKAKRILHHALTEQRISHAYLFEGPSGTGKLAAANAFAKALFCLQPVDGKACDSCQECRKFEHGNQSDVRYITPEGQSIKIDQIRQLQRDLSYRTTANRQMVYIIEQAEKMTIQAANSLLKFLEEPISPVVALLITSNEQAMLPTIRSRTMRVPFTPLAPEVMLEQLIAEGAAPTLARAAVQLSSGLDGARAILEKNGFAEIRTLVIQLGKESITKYTAAMITAAQKLFKGDFADQIELVLQLLLLWFKDMTQFQAGRQDKLVFIDQLEWISAHAFSRSFAGWIACMEHVLEADKRMKANVTPQLSFEQLLVKLQEG